MVGFAQYGAMTLYVAHFISYVVWITVLSMLSWGAVTSAADRSK
jgi:hypothetical protein